MQSFKVKQYFYVFLLTFVQLFLLFNLMQWDNQNINVTYERKSLINKKFRKVFVFFWLYERFVISTSHHLENDKKKMNLYFEIEDK